MAENIISKIKIGDLEYALVDTNAITFKSQALTEEQKAQARENIGLGSNGIANAIEPMEDDIPKVFFGAALPQTKNDTIMSFRYISKTANINGYCKTKAQGNSSMGFPKKNQTVKLYTDAACTEKLKIDFKGWGKQNKFCFKANWIDLTHARNIVSARLWGDVVKSRSNYAEIPELLRTSPNQGAVDGFPVKVYAGGVYQGRYTINIPKDAWMANMDDELNEHCILCGENYESGCFRAEANIDGTDWTDEIHDTVPETILNRWNDAISFINDSTSDEFISGISEYFDVASLIDYYIFGVLICNTDGFGKNQLFQTYDGQKWYATVYDMDCVFGTYFSSFLSANYPRSSFEDFDDGRAGNLLYIRLENLFTDAIKERYLELKDGALSLTNIVNRFERFTDICPPHLVNEDYAETTMSGMFTDIPLQGQNNIQQIRNYIVKRYDYVEKYILSLHGEGSLLYRLPQETIFDGTDDYINTGVKLFDEAKDFTIICDATLNNAGGLKGIYSCYQNDNGGELTYGGLACVTTLDSYNGYLFRGKTGTYGDVIFNDSIISSLVKHAVVYTQGVPTALYYLTEDGGYLLEGVPMSNNRYLQQNTELLLGCGFGWYQIENNFCPVTFREFEVWDYAMSKDEVVKKLGASIYTEGSLLYRLPQETIFDGTDDYINTGVKLFDEAKDFTIICDATLPSKALTCIYSAYHNGNGDSAYEAGFSVSRSVADYNNTQVNAKSSVNGNIYAYYEQAVNVVKHVLVFKAGVPFAMYYIAEDGGDVQTAQNIDFIPVYATHNDPLLIGCGVGWYQTNNNFADMTMHSFEVWNYAMTPEEAVAKLESL